MRTLQVALAERSYPIHIGAGLLSSFPLAEQVRGNQVMIITNETIAPLYLASLEAQFSATQCDTLILPDGEKYKTLETLETIFDALMAKRHSRTTTLIALGGGVVGDMVGFAAACYQRGVDFIQVPTTLLAQVDSSVGGKTAVNHPRGKNMIGAFHQPRLVLIDTDVLSTLPERELAAGYAEVVKYGLIRDPDFYQWLETNNSKLLSREESAISEAIFRSCENKAQVVADDETEQGNRALLNLGHTFGHAIETATGYSQWLHGEAVAVGMLMAIRMSAELGWVPDTLEPDVVALLSAWGLPVAVPAEMTPEQFVDLMAMDKKVHNGQLRLVLLRALGKAVVTADYDEAALQKRWRLFVEHDDERFYSGASRGDFLDAMTAHAGLGSVVAIEGDTGSGVSTLLGQAVMALLADMEVVRIDGSEPHDANVVVDALLRHFDIDRAELPQVLRDTLSNGRLVVVVDNSEDVRADALTTMAALKQKLGARLCYLFGGLPGTVEALKSVDFTVDDVLDLPTLNADDVQDFAWFVVGEELDEDESERLAHRSEGLPGALLGLLQGTRDSAAAVPVGAATHSQGSAAEAGETDDEMSDMPGFSARSSDDEDDDDQVDAEAPVSPADTAPASRTTAPWRHGAAVVGLLLVVILLWSVLSGGDDEDAAQDSRELALPVPESVPSKQQEVAPQEPGVTPLKPTMEPVARLEDIGAEPEDEESKVEAAPNSNVQLAPVTDPVMQSSPAQAQQEIAVAPAPDKPADSAPSEPESEEGKAASPSAQEKPTTETSGYNQAAWLAALDDSRWFLQITATSQEANARAVLDQLDRKGAYYPAKRNGKTVFLVLAGDYSSRQAALDAKSTLPAKLRSAGLFLARWAMFAANFKHEKAPWVTVQFVAQARNV